jgi:hypothetical protein
MSGKVPMKETRLGLWGVSSIEDVHKIFKKLRIKGKFLDLGSGDGKVVAIASLFTDNCTGIECDKELIDISDDFKAQLGYNAKFILGDYMQHKLDDFDWLFLNPDHDLDKLEKKLLEELNGKVIVYSNIYFFKHLKIEKELSLSGITVRVYTR